MWTNRNLVSGADIAASAIGWVRVMLLTLMLLGLGLALVGLAGCEPVQSLSPFFESRDVIFDSGLLGEWTSKTEDGFWMKLRFEGRREESEGYSIKATFHSDTPEEGKPGEGSVTFSVYLFQVEGSRFLDFYPVKYSARYGTHEIEFDASENLFGVPTHTVYRANVSGREMRLAWLDDSYVKRFVETNQLPLAASESDPFVLTGKTGELKTALLAHAEQEGLLDREEIVLTRPE